MLVYTYDGSFAGLLCCLFDSMEKDDQLEAIVEEHKQVDELFSRPLGIVTDARKAANMQAQLQKRLPRKSMHVMQRAFLADVADREMAVCRYVRFGFKVGKALDRYLSQDCVRRVHELARKVGTEAHRLHGFVRFRELNNGLYYAPVTPDHYVLSLLAKFFAMRLPDRPWIIHDTKRNHAVLFQGKRWTIVPLRAQMLPELSRREISGQALWKSYVRHIAIPERTNLKLQQQFVPLRYRSHMVEFDRSNDQKALDAV